MMNCKLTAFPEVLDSEIKIGVKNNEEEESVRNAVNTSKFLAVQY